MTTIQLLATAPRHRAEVPPDSPTRAQWPFTHFTGLHRWTGADVVEWRPATPRETRTWVTKGLLGQTRLVAGVGLMVPA